MLESSSDLLSYQQSLELFCPKHVKERPSTLLSYPVVRTFEDGIVKCYICKVPLVNNIELKQHLFSKLHKENANTHCIYRLPKNSQHKRQKKPFKVPEAKKMFRKVFSEPYAKGMMTPQTTASRKTSTFSSPVEKGQGRGELLRGQLARLIDDKFSLSESTGLDTLDAGSLRSDEQVHDKKRSKRKESWCDDKTDAADNYKKKKASESC
eukprot:TRINITY_DN3361_c0_g1_i3.p1 TRINITY_DN3361_c0_g1~~TRINITY_DN3361_c0_g1_i3.p1  ORF type:complete len:209 (-),score=38.69 TRINITY_DN3361_c0_g1_i3:155-781(-)